MSNSLPIARKELASYFASPAAFIFLGLFMLATLFIFFWVETFFARNIADVRPLFNWMPILLIFLCSAITMRMWSEERRAGTLEFLLTSPVATLQFVLGKFFACLGLVVLALLLTLPLPLSVALLGPLDWGPVLGAYVATLCLAAAYIAIGLYISARSDNQIVSLMLTVLICGVFYLIGSEGLIHLLSSPLAEYFKLFGSGSRFESITRGVLDLRDIYYYLSIVGVFLSLNVYSVEKLRWASQKKEGAQRHWRWLTGLFVVNFLFSNIWMQQLNGFRADITEGRIYSISEATDNYLAQLQEPLLIRGYFSPQTHPLLAPLGPQIRDLIKEYEVAAQGKVRVEFVDPLENPELEKEAGEKFGIQPIAFQTADKYQSALVNSYFDILIQYGDQYEVLGFRDLIDIKAMSETEVEVQLRNPEYDITSAIKKVLYAYQGSGDLFLNIIRKPVTFNAFISTQDKLPEQLQVLHAAVNETVQEIAIESGGVFRVETIDPDANGGGVAEQLKNEYGFRPMSASLFDSNTFWFYMVLSDGEQTIQVPLPEDLSASGVKRGIEAALKRFSSGFLKTVAFSAPTRTPPMPQFGLAGGGMSFSMLEEQLRQSVSLSPANLKQGHVPEDADLLMVVAPKEMDDKQLFAMDQFLMRGGTVVIAASAFDVNLQGQFSVTEKQSGLEGWLQHQGISLEKKMVMDLQNSAFPVPMQRDLGGFMVQEVQLVDYPYFVDIRDSGMNSEVGLTAGIPQLTLNWASPIVIDESKNSQRKITRLLESSERSWTSESTQVQPDFQRYELLGFPEGTDQKRSLVAAAVAGEFVSYFKDKPSPLLNIEETKNEESEEGAETEGESDTENKKVAFNRVIDKSPASAQIILYGSETFLSDSVIDLASSVGGNLYSNPLILMENTVDWALEDEGLLSIRSRDHFARTLNPIDKNGQLFWEYLNYVLGGMALLLLWLGQRLLRKKAQARYQRVLRFGD